MRQSSRRFSMSGPALQAGAFARSTAHDRSQVVTAAADRHLLFGLLALQNGLIDQGQLVLAFQAWTLDKSKGLADHLEARGDLDADDRAGRRGPGGPAHQAARGRRGEEPRRRHRRQVNPRAPGRAGRSGHRGDARPGGLGARSDRGRRRRPHHQLRRGHGHQRRRAVPRPASSRPRRPRHRLRGARRRAEPRGGSQADPGQARGRPDKPRRFLLEAEVTGGLEHPGIVPVYGLGTYADGRPYYAMRFIRGDSLKEAIEHFHADDSLKKDPGRRSLELRKLLRRFTDVCNAIDYAHSRGVLHRDLKPSNIVVGKHGETLVVNWGLAKATGKAEPGAEERTLMPTSASGSAETLPGSALGTPAYMSPEQARGDLEHLGPRSDVYSLGATLYCLLTGKPSQEGDDIGAVLRNVQRGEFPRPRQLDPGIEPALAAVCLKAMATRPEDRYPSCRAWPTTSSGGRPTSRCRCTAPRPRCGWPAGRTTTEPGSPSGRGCCRRRWSSWPSARSCWARRGRGSIASAGPPRRPGRGPRRSTTSWSTTCSGRPTRSATPSRRTSPCASCSTGPPGRWPSPSRSPAIPGRRERSAQPSATPTWGWGSTRRPSNNWAGPRTSCRRAAPPRRRSSSPRTAASWPTR